MSSTVFYCMGEPKVLKEWYNEIKEKQGSAGRKLTYLYYCREFIQEINLFLVSPCNLCESRVISCTKCLLQEWKEGLSFLKVFPFLIIQMHQEAESMTSMKKG